MLKMGLQPISDEEWIEPFSISTLKAFSKHKARELDDGTGAILVDPAAKKPLLELQQCLLNYLARAPQAYPSTAEEKMSLGSGEADDEGILRNMSFWVPDDICILQPQSALGLDGDDYVLTAASVLSPSHWKPQVKFLKPLAAIHQPIPGFHRELTPKITRFFNHLKVGKPVLRYNWGIQPGGALHWHSETEPEITRETDLYYRSERQTLMRLPESEAVVFFIRIDVCLIAQMPERYQDPLAIEKLKAFIKGMPHPQKEYKGILRFPWLLE